MVVWETDRQSGTTREPASWPDYLDYTRDARTLKATAAIVGGDVSLTTEEGEPTRASVMAATWGFLDLIGVKPLLGRAMTEAEDRPTSALVCLIGERLWKSRFGADPAIVGKTIRLNDQAHTVIGVVPAGIDFGIDQIYARAAYHGPWLGTGEVDVWVSAGQTVGNVPRNSHPAFMVARLADGVSLEAASTELNRLSATLERTYPENANRGVLRRVTARRDARPGASGAHGAAGGGGAAAGGGVRQRGQPAAGPRGAAAPRSGGALGARGGPGTAGPPVHGGDRPAHRGRRAGGVRAGALRAPRACSRSLPRTFRASTMWDSTAGCSGITALVAVLVGVVFGLVPTLQSFRVDVMSQIKGDSPLGGRPTNRLRNGLVDRRAGALGHAGAHRRGCWCGASAT